MDEFEQVRAEERRARRNVLIVIWITHVVVAVCLSLTCTAIIQSIFPESWFRTIVVFAVSWAIGTYGTRWTIRFLKRKELW
jgi:hypothetical protein